MKKILVLLLCISMVLSFVACSSEDNNVKVDNYECDECNGSGEGICSHCGGAGSGCGDNACKVCQYGECRICDGDGQWYECLSCDGKGYRKAQLRKSTSGSWEFVTYID